MLHASLPPQTLTTQQVTRVALTYTARNTGVFGPSEWEHGRMKSLIQRDGVWNAGSRTGGSKPNVIVVPEFHTHF